VIHDFMGIGSSVRGFEIDIVLNSPFRMKKRDIGAVGAAISSVSGESR
jgi:hypothetical protein